MIAALASINSQAMGRKKQFIFVRREESRA
jgi:hypothetical protein